MPDEDDDLDDEQRARRLLAHLLEFHRREEKSMWWEFFDRCGLGPEELIEHRATLGGLTYAGAVEEVKRSTVHRYRFPEQTHEIAVGDSPKNPDTAESDDLQRGFCGTVLALDEAARTIDLKRGRKSPVPHPAALVPLDAVNSKVLQESLLRLAQEVVSSRFAPDSPRRAAIDLLRRVPPRVLPATRLGTLSLGGETATMPPAESSLVAEGEAPLDAVLRIAPGLDRSVLPVQGPPGSGKTYTGARMILDLLADGKRVGVTANSHKVVSNLLGAVCRANVPSGPSAEAAPATVRGIQKANASDSCPDERIIQAGKNEAVAEALATGEANLAGGTAWLWAREEMADAVDVLVIDEAGQMSLANTLAVCQAARSLVLLGDPRQLDQPIQGVHPPGAGRLGTRPPPRGVGDGQPVPRRLSRPDVAHAPGRVRVHDRAVSTKGGSAPDPSWLVRRCSARDRCPATACASCRSSTPATRNASEEEAARVAALIRELLDAGAAWVDRDGVGHPLGLEDILVVAPYNAHVATLRGKLPDGARTGTVDKFQGQEAPIVLYSMATSSADEAPRGMEFLYSLHRLNVATSRARCVAAIVASPALLAPSCRTPEQMRLANPFCRFLELASAAPPLG